MLRRCLLYGVVIVLLNVPALVSAREAMDLGQVVVSATKTEEDVKKLSSSVTVITREDIENKKVDTVAELLREVPGLDVARRGGPGKMTSVYLRGGNSGHVLVLIDGIQVNSPTTGSFNFANLTTDNIERIEIVRGPQSTLYGSDAMGGVINIITRKGKGKPKVSLTAEGGSFESMRQAASLIFGADKVDFSLVLSHSETDGISAAKAENADNDGYINNTASLKLGFQPTSKTRLETVLRLTDSRTDLDQGSTDDPNWIQNTQEMVLGVNLNQNLSEWWEHLLKFQLTKSKLDNNDPDTPRNNSQIDSSIQQAEWQHSFHLFEDADILTVGAEYEEQAGENNGMFDKTIRNRALYIQNQLALLDETLYLTAGARVDKHSLFGSWDTYRLGASYLVKATGTRVKANYGTAFKAPTLNDLYYQISWAVGNPSLKPEESWGYDLGLEQRFWKDRIFLGATYFHNTFDNLINWDWSVSPMQPQNVDEATTEGVELEMSIKPIEQVQLKLNYTQTRAKDKTTDKELSRRPEHKANLVLDVQPMEDAHISLSLKHVGKRWDDPANTQDIAAYFKLDLAAYYDLSENVQVFARAENLLDEKYEEVIGYNSMGTAVYGGVKLTF